MWSTICPISVSQIYNHLIVAGGDGGSSYGALNSIDRGGNSSDSCSFAKYPLKIMIFFFRGDFPVLGTAPSQKKGSLGPAQLLHAPLQPLSGCNGVAAACTCHILLVSLASEPEV